jgi:arylformamidase
MKRIIDLTHTINEEMTVYPGNPKLSLKEVSTFEKNGYSVLEMKTITHNGTHIDAPFHMVPGTKTLDQYALDKFTGKAIVIDSSKEKEISLNFLKKHKAEISKADFVLFYSGWSKKWNKKSYFGAYPVLTVEAAEWLTKFKLKALGFDYISIDPVTSTDMKLHKIVLSKDICIIENLNDLDKIPEGMFDFYCVPIKIERADGSPVRAFAEIIL